jgi:hypothetical protein
MTYILIAALNDDNIMTCDLETAYLILMQCVTRKSGLKVASNVVKTRVK